MSCYIYNRRLKKRLNTFLKKNFTFFIDFGEKLHIYYYYIELQIYFLIFSYGIQYIRLYGHAVFLYRVKKDEHQDDH